MLRKYSVELFEPEVKCDEVLEMLIEIANGDLTKVNELKRCVSKKVLYNRYYQLRVKKLNELIEHNGYLRSLES